MQLDSKTNLIWQDNIDSKKKNVKWANAVRYCKDLRLDGYTNWKLPNIIELLSIVDKSKYNPAIYSTFKNVSPLYYWSSSPYVSNPINSWGVDFGTGNDGAYNKSHSIYIRCVHSNDKK